MTMFHHSIGVLIVIAVVFALAKRMKVTTELSMFLAALFGALAHMILPKGVDPRSAITVTELLRHVVEGAFTYYDVCLIFMSATFFMALFKEAGGVAFIVRKIVRSFAGHRFVCLLLLTVVMLIPGAITGSGATTVLTVGALVGSVLAAMGVPETRRVALVFMLAAMSAAAPPINLWAMMAAAGANMPYVGFAKPLLILSVAGALFSTFYLAGKGDPVDTEKALSGLPEAPEGWNWFKAALPFLTLAALVLAGRIWPYTFPIVGLPLIFMICAAVTIILSPVKLRILDVATDTVKNLLGLVGIMVVVGSLIQVMALSGARGLISLAVVTLPMTVLFATLWIILPLSEGLVQYAVAPLIGVPLIMLFNMKGLDPIVSLSAWAVMWPLGDCLPPTAVVGRATVMEMDYKGRYFADFVKACIVPSLFVALLCTLFLIYSKKLAFLGG
ncbi:C4-dicarboxylate anaerobic carrier [Dethiosulfovibrio peptidovorans DSM 11002]|uniref:C4-dicarboxylate anaerobic carrier n=1 Tax=Dethiosulfovibrio peptidovorans DSM 11002 TaxID=469381 RepID=D2Z7H9_9BACT|nr:C4-dicarboxylate anaerobic carrier [Dethiosulfovibrio peptidovorans DSM 11002]